MAITLMDWDQYQIAAGDTDTFINNFNNYLAALEVLVGEQNSLAQGVDGVADDVAELLSQANAVLGNVIQARDDAQSAALIAAGDVIRDGEISLLSGWSSQKIKAAIDEVQFIDDEKMVATFGWSSQKINNEIIKSAVSSATLIKLGVAPW